MSTVREAVDALNEKHLHEAGFHLAMLRLDKLEYTDMFGGDSDGDAPHDLMAQTYDWRFGGQPDKEEYTVKLTASNMRYIGRALEIYNDALMDVYSERMKEELKAVINGMAKAQQEGIL